MDEKTAKSKWCPMVRHEGNEHGSFNRGGIFGLGKGYGCNCIASACMLWHDDGYCGLVVKFPILNERRVI